MGDLIILRSLDHDCCYFLHLEIQGASFPWQVNWQRDHNLPRSAGYVFMSDGCRTPYACGFDFFFFFLLGNQNVYSWPQPGGHSKIS